MPCLAVVAAEIMLHHLPKPMNRRSRNIRSRNMCNRSISNRFLTSSISNVAGGMIAAYDDGPKEVIPWQGRFGAAYLLPFSEPETETLHPDPSGQVTERSGAPQEYVLGMVESTIGQFSNQPTVSVAAECVPYRGVDLGFRLGFSSVGDAAFGLFLTPPIDGQNLRFDFAARRDYEFGGITWHVMVSKRFGE
jgi:hypothetical protein